MIQFFLNNVPIILNIIFIPLASLYLFKTFSKIKSKSALILTLLAFVVIYSIIALFVSIMPIRFVLTYGCVLLLSFSFLMKTSYRLLLSGVTMALLGIADVLTFIVHQLIFDISSEETYIEPYYSLGVIQTFTIIFVVLFIIDHTKHNRFANSHSKKAWILYALPIATVLAIWTEYAIATKFELSNGLKLLLIINAFMLILTNFIVFYFSDSIYDKLQYEYKLRIAEEMIWEQSKKYFSLVENSTEVRRLKHDQCNFILGVIDSLKKEKYDDLEEHLNKRLDTLQKVSYNSPGIPIFETIITYKQTEAAKHGIRIICDTNVKGMFQFDSIDFAIILGNLLDNAIEATSKIEDSKPRNIDVFIESKSKHILLSITNPVEKDINAHELKTTKLDKKNHGFGLLSVQKIVDKYTGSFLLKCKDRIFEASIILPQPESTNRDAHNAKHV